MIAHHHDPIDSDAVQNDLARPDRRGGIVVEDGCPVRALQACHRIMGDVTHVHELLLPEVDRIVEWDGECPGAAI
jgi:hypothetical protein